MKKLYFLFFAFLISGLSFGQTEVFNVPGGGTLPAGWAGTNNVVTNDIDRTSYYLVDAGDPSDIIETAVYDLSAYDSAEFKLNVASFGSGTHNQAKIEISFDGGSSYTQVELSTTTTGSSYIDGGTFALNSVTNQVKIKISNSGISGRGVRLQDLVLLGYDTNPLILVGTGVTGLNYVFGGSSSEGTFTVEGVNLTNDIILTPPTDFEISKSSGSGFTDVNIALDGSSGTIATTTIYARLKSGLDVNSYAGNVDVESTGASTKTVSLSGNVFNPVTNSLVLTAAYDGPLSGGNPKGIELFALDNIPDLSIYGISSISNGGGSSAGTVEYSFPADNITKGTFIYVAIEATQFANFFGFAPTYVTGTVSINGDDSIELYESGQIIDTFGDVDMDGSGEVWDHLDGWAYRSDDTGPDGTFVSGNWYYSGVDALDGETTNAGATTPIPAGTYMNTLSSNQFNANHFKMYPNPTSLGHITISSKSNSKIDVSVFDVLGKQVLKSTVKENRLDVSSLKTGLYIMKVSQDDATTTKKLVIQ